jgi:hypothetical protein
MSLSSVAPVGDKGLGNLTRADRKLMSSLRRQVELRPWLCEQEERVAAFVEDWQVEEAAALDRCSPTVPDTLSDDGWVHLSSDPPSSDECLSMQVDSPFLRLILHALCRYYGLLSESRDVGSDRIVCVRKGRRVGVPSRAFTDIVYADAS